MPALMTANDGMITTRRRSQSGIRNDTKPCMTAWPAITPTMELEKPGANSASINRPAVAKPRDTTGSWVLRRAPTLPKGKRACDFARSPQTETQCTGAYCHQEPNAQSSCLADAILIPKGHGVLSILIKRRASSAASSVLGPHWFRVAALVRSRLRAAHMRDHRSTDRCERGSG
jgi:hypothetical protein